MTKRIREYDYSEISRMLREAADTIESLRERAQAATLGSGECENTWDVELTGRLRFQCSECGAVSLEITPNYCPNCGKAVKQ